MTNITKHISSTLSLLIAVVGAAAMVLCGCNGRRHNGEPVIKPAPNAGIVLSDVTDRSGIDYRWVITGKSPYNILQTIGNGCAFLDYNNDGNLDILLVGQHPALYQGDGHGHFTDVSSKLAGGKLNQHFLGCAVGDYDNDGYEDIYLSAYHGGVLLHNRHGEGFDDVTAASGIKPQPWGTSCAFVDVDGDGKLDLYVGNYVKFGPDVRPQLCASGALMTVCGPNLYTAEFGVLYRNLSGGKFEDVTHECGADKVAGKDLGVATADFDGSGHQSIYLANDEQPGDFLQNLGRSFKNIGAASGTAYDANANNHGGMGVDWGDYDNDGKLDLIVTTFQNEPKCIYHNDGSDIFSEQSSALNIDHPTVPMVAFGTKWIDLDNDGWLDIIIANGHVEDNVHEIDNSKSYRQPVQVFHNEHGQSFIDITAALQAPANRPIVGRGVAIGDIDNDGKMDALVVDSEGKPMLLHNETPRAGHWLLVNLVGTKSNRDGQGALVTVQAGGASYLRQCTTGGSYLSASDKRVHFGLGAASVADKIVVQWPSRDKSVYTNVAADRIITLKEGTSEVLAYPVR